MKQQKVCQIIDLNDAFPKNNLFNNSEQKSKRIIIRIRIRCFWSYVTMSETVVPQKVMKFKVTKSNKIRK